MRLNAPEFVRRQADVEALEGAGGPQSLTRLMESCLDSQNIYIYIYSTIFSLVSRFLSTDR
jgi:hypothetical protein